MTHKKVTIKDVAREAGVSVATVSYVVNNRTDLKITDETRKKVLQVIHLLNYTPNQTAKALATNRKGMLAFSLPAEPSLLKRAEQMYLLQYFMDYFHSKNYELLLLNSNFTEKYDQADAIICYDLSSKQFYQLGDNNFVPLIALDCMIDDPLFFQINSDPKRMQQEADTQFGISNYRFAILDTNNQEKLDFYRTYFPNPLILHDFADIYTISGENLLVSSHTLYEALQANNRVCYIPALHQEKADLLLKCIEAAIDRIPIDRHHLLV